MTTQVLVVEDDPAIQALIRFTLEKAGLKAEIADITTDDEPASAEKPTA